MRMIEKIISSIPIEYSDKWAVSANLGLTKGELGIYFMDPSHLEMDNAFINERSHPNCGIMNAGRHAMWISMFERYMSNEGEIDETDE